MPGDLALFPNPPDDLYITKRESPTVPELERGGFNLPDLTDDDISDLLEELKSLPHDYVKSLKPVKKSKMQYSQAELTMTGDRGSEFKVIIRKNLLDPLDFSIILIYLPKGGSCSVGITASTSTRTVSKGTSCTTTTFI